jgi:hypothetical protein
MRKWILKPCAVGLLAELLTPGFNGLAVCYCDTQPCLCHDAWPVKVKNAVNIKCRKMWIHDKTKSKYSS